MESCEIEPAILGSSAIVDSRRSDGSGNRFVNLRGVRWRVDLGILPSSSSIDDLRRVTAESRRRYAALRRRLLIDPHIPKDRNNSPDIAIDNPLSQNPESSWGRFFRSAELEKTLDQDLSRLYPEHGSYFQAAGCQGLLRRILLLWCLGHPEYGYRQGMHELLAPLLYVLQVDIERLSEVRKNHEDHFTDRFDGLTFEECDVAYNFDFKNFPISMDDEINFKGISKKIKSLDELDPEIQAIVRLSDAYGTEGELGIVLSEKFMEHDAYSMFDALMSGSHGSVAMADFFAHSPITGSHTGLPPVLEASAALYQVLSIVDSSLHSHFVELGVEPQYFSLRWLRVLFGREFLLQDLLIVWDEIFSADNSKPNVPEELDLDSSFRILISPRGALITGMAVSMILYLRSSLLATETATSCLQRLLNFPDNIDLSKIIEKAKSLQNLALDVNISSSPFINGFANLSSTPLRGNHQPSGSVSPKSPLIIVPDSYWEEKWRDMHKAEEEQSHSNVEKRSPTRTPKVWSRLKQGLSKARSGLSANKAVNVTEETKSALVRRSLLEDLSQELGPESPDPEETSEFNHIAGVDSLETEENKNLGFGKEFLSAGEESVVSGNAGSEENSSTYSEPTSPLQDSNYIENGSVSSSVASNLCLDDKDDQQITNVDFPLPVSHPLGNESPDSESHNGDNKEKSAPSVKEKNFLSGKFQWLWKFGRNNNVTAGSSSENNESLTNAAKPKEADRSKNETAEENVVDLKNLGQTMLEHIQAIESAFQQEQDSSAPFDKGQQATATTALKELREISNLLSEMQVSS